MSRQHIKNNFVQFFGTRVDLLNRGLAITIGRQFLDSQSIHHIVTPNTEIIMSARKNTYLQKVIGEAQMRLPDGIGLVWASKWLYNARGVERVSGADFVLDLCQLANEKKQSILLITKSEGLDPKAGIKAVDVLKKKYPKVRFSTIAVSNTDTIDFSKSADIVLVGLGAPNQDIWIYKNKLELQQSGVRIAMGVGASIDFIAGVQKRAPLFMQKMGLEWLWRLIKQPARLKRQLAIPHFIWLILLTKLHIIKNRQT